ncbi:MAG TPA: tetratricopeptide repeat protein [Polyangiaceae bacterium]|jgi:Flp pilus assembly protein TadD|nr:tetratricopeptide repeat protein [Polyangiaceae bacterium]
MTSTEGTDRDPADAAHWAAVEEATELLHEERFREALVELRNVIQADPKNPYAYHFLGVALFEVGEVEAARDAYGASLKLAPHHLGSRVALAHVLRMTGDIRGAIREGLAALSQAPGDADALYAVGLAYHARGDESAAVKYLEAFLATGPEYEVGVETRALLAVIRGDPEPPPDD